MGREKISMDIANKLLYSELKSKEYMPFIVKSFCNMFADYIIKYGKKQYIIGYKAGKLKTQTK